MMTDYILSPCSLAARGLSQLMLNAANLLLVLAARIRGNVDAQSAALIVLVLAAAEAVIGLGIALALFRDRAQVDVDEPAEVRG